MTTTPKTRAAISMLKNVNKSLKAFMSDAKQRQTQVIRTCKRTEQLYRDIIQYSTKVQLTLNVAKSIFVRLNVPYHGILF
jgi:hypothetical protein